MQKKVWIISTISFILGVLVGSICMYYYKKEEVKPTPITNTETKKNEQKEESNSLNLPTEGNDTVLTTNSKTTLRVINEYDNTFFNKKKNLLIMFASWCPNCQEEISEIEKILKHYNNSKDVNIILIAHEYNDTVTDLISLVENDVDFGNVEIKIDLGRIIRKNIDPEASTIPISYVVDKNGTVLEYHNDSLTLKKAQEMLGK